MITKKTMFPNPGRCYSAPSKLVLTFDEVIAIYNNDKRKYDPHCYDATSIKIWFSLMSKRNGWSSSEFNESEETCTLTFNYIRNSMPSPIMRDALFIVDNIINLIGLIGFETDDDVFDCIDIVLDNTKDIIGEEGDVDQNAFIREFITKTRDLWAEKMRLAGERMEREDGLDIE